MARHTDKNASTIRETDSGAALPAIGSDRPLQPP